MLLREPLEFSERMLAFDFCEFDTAVAENADYLKGTLDTFPARHYFGAKGQDRADRRWLRSSRRPSAAAFTHANG